MRQSEREKRIATLEAALRVVTNWATQRDLDNQLSREKAELKRENAVREEYRADLGLDEPISENES